MSEILRRIRKSVVRSLIDARTPAGDRVYGNRFRPVWDDDLPAVLVFTIEESSRVFDESPRRYMRTARVAIACMVKAAETREDDADDVLDALAEQVEQVLFFDRTLGDLANDSRLSDWRVEALEAQGRSGRKLLAVGRLVLEVDYLQEAGEGGDVRALDDFTETRVHTRASGTSRIDAEDHLELPRPT